MRYSTVAGVVLAAALAVSAGQGKGECPKAGPGGGHPGEGGLWKELGLTPQQREQLRELRLEQAGPNREFRQRMHDIRRATKEEFAKENPSKAALDKLASQLGDLAEDLAKEKVNHLLEVKKVLTKEQWAKLIERNWMMDLGPAPDGPPGPRPMLKRGKGCPPPKCPHLRPPADEPCPPAEEERE